MSETRKIAVAITGASGAIYAQRLMEHLSAPEFEVHLILSKHAMMVITHELEPNREGSDKSHPVSKYIRTDNAHIYNLNDYSSPLASGSVATDGMVIIPCTAGTIGRIASGISSSLIDRAADVHLKENRKIIAVLRESPYSQILIENMLKFSRAGGTIIPASPGFYHNPASINDVVDSVVARVLDHLNISHDMKVRWTVDCGLSND